MLDREYQDILESPSENTLQTHFPFLLTSAKASGGAEGVGVALREAPGACTLGQPSHSPGLQGGRENQVQLFAHTYKNIMGMLFDDSRHSLQRHVVNPGRGGDDQREGELQMRTRPQWSRCSPACLRGEQSAGA